MVTAPTHSIYPVGGGDSRVDGDGRSDAMRVIAVNGYSAVRGGSGGSRHIILGQIDGYCLAGPR